jgi:hypothetical protein
MRQIYPDQHGSALPPQNVKPRSAPDNSGTIALLEQWAREDATDDTTAIAQAERELGEFKANLNANRPPDRPVFP